MAVLVVVAVVLALLVLWAVARGGRLPAPFHGRPCQGVGWRRAFPAASKQEIREFLSLFIEAFAFSQSERLKLNPSDSILGLYRAVYPKSWMPDALELEILVRLVQEKYGLSLVSVWHERLTLGALFAQARLSAGARQ